MRLHREAWGSALSNLGASFLGCQTKYHRLGGLTYEKLILSQPGGQESEVRV